MHLGIIKITHNRTAQPRYYHNAFYGRLFREPRRGGNSDFATTIWSFWIFAIDCSNAEFWTLCVCVCVCVCVCEREGGSQRSVVREREKGGDHSVASCERKGQRERGSQRSIVCVCVCVFVCARERVTAQHRVCVCERESERGPQRSVVCKREGHSAAASWVCVCEREEDTVIQPHLCASTYELHHSVCHATLFRSRTDGKTKEIINCL